MNSVRTGLSQIIFMSRWLQAPLYLGLIFAQGLYTYRFSYEIYDLVINGMKRSETDVMLSVLGLIDVVMISNLLIMVVIGGYETFVSRLKLDGHPDKPEWLNRVNTGTLKIKLALSLISISSIHLLETFINVDHLSDHVVMWQIAIHLTFVFSAVALAVIDRISHTPQAVRTANNMMRRREDKMSG